MQGRSQRHGRVSLSPRAPHRAEAPGRHPLRGSTRARRWRGPVRDTRLRLDTAQRAVTNEVDELMAIFVDDPRTLDTMRGDQPRGVAQTVREVFPEIAKLSPQGNVHGRMLYSAVNTVTRAAPLDVFAALVASGTYVPVGDNYWHLGD